jgi:hypothetical protein
MTEHEHMPPIRHWYSATWLSPGRLLVHMPKCEYVLNREEAKLLRDSIDSALDGDGPKVICEVVR